MFLVWIVVLPPNKLPSLPGTTIQLSVFFVFCGHELLRACLKAPALTGYVGDSQCKTPHLGRFARIDSQKNPYFHNVRAICADRLKLAIRNFSPPKHDSQKKGFHWSWRQIWRVTGRESGFPELLGSPRTSPEVPRTSPEVFGDFPGSSLTVELNSNPEVPRKFPKLPRKFRDFPGGQPLSLGSLIPSPDSQKLSLIQFGHPETLRETQAIRPNLRTDSRDESGQLEVCPKNLLRLSLTSNVIFISWGYFK